MVKLKHLTESLVSYNDTPNDFCLSGRTRVNKPTKSEQVGEVEPNEFFGSTGLLW